MFQTARPTSALTPTFDLAPLSSSTPNPAEYPSSEVTPTTTTTATTTSLQQQEYGGNTPSTIHSTSDVADIDSTCVSSPALSTTSQNQTSGSGAAGTSKCNIQFTSKPNPVLKKPVPVYPQHSQFFLRQHSHQPLSDRLSQVLEKSRSRPFRRSYSEGHLTEVKVVMEEEEIMEYERAGLSME